MLRYIVIITSVMMISNLNIADWEDDAAHLSLLMGSSPLSQKDHSPVEILSDNDMLDLAISEDLKGNGSDEDPFVIEGWSIDAQAGSYCMKITDISYSLVIINCSLYNTSMVSSSILNAKAALELSGNNNLTLENITIFNSGLGIRTVESERLWVLGSTFHDVGHGIYIRDSTICNIQTSMYMNITGYGIYISYNTPTIKDNIFRSVTSPFYMTMVNNGKIISNFIENGGGINLENCLSMLVSKNSVNSSSSIGYRLQNTHDSHFEESVASKCNIGYYLWNSDRNNFTKISSVNSDNNGFQMIYSDDCIIQGSVIHSNTNGIQMSNSNDNRINSSSIRFNKNDGIRATASHGNDIESNFISHGLENGISIINSMTMIIRNNHIQNNNINGIKLINVRYSEISGNHIERHQDAINLDGTRNNILNENILYDPNNGIYMYSSIDDMIYNNIIDSCRNHGIVLSETSNIDVKNNSIQKNRFYGLYAFNAVNTVAINNAFLENNGVRSFLNISKVQASCVNSPTLFNDSSGGNYWRDHVAPDLDDDGYVDTPYPISTGQYDMRPLSDPPFNVVPGPVIDPTCRSLKGPIWVNYTEPELDGGSPIILYRLYRNDGGSIRPFKDLDASIDGFIDRFVINGRRYQYRISAINEIGEGQLSPIISIISDSTPPSVKIKKPDDGIIISTSSIMLSWDATGDQWEDMPPLLDILVDNITIASGITGSTYRIDDLSDGSHTIALDSYDWSGNHNMTSIDIFVDTISPVVRILDPTNGSYHNRTDIEVNYLIYDNGSGLRYASYGLEGGIHYPIPFGSSFVLDGLLEGKHILSLKAEDHAGNTDEDITKFFIDITPPELKIISPSNGYLSNTSTITVYIHYNDNISGVGGIIVTVNHQDRETLPPTNEILIDQLDEGENQIIITVIDNAGNRVLGHLNVRLDTEMPTVIDFGPIDFDNPVNSTIFAEFSEAMNISTVRLQITENVGYLFWSGNRAILTPDLPLTYNTTYRITVNGRDKAGNPLIPFSWDFSTTNKGWIKGIVLDESRVPMRDVEISISDSRIYLTGDDGGFDIWISSGKYELKVNHSGYAQRQFEIILAPGQTVELGVIILNWMGEIGHVEGRIVDNSGKPVIGVVITADTAETETTGEDGIFRMDLSPGEHVLYIYREGYLNATVRVDVIENNITYIGDIELQQILREKDIDGPIDPMILMVIFIVIFFLGSLLIIAMIHRKKTRGRPIEE